MCVFDVCMCFLACLARQKIDMMQVLHPEFSMHIMEKMKSPVVMYIFVKGDWHECGCWKLKMRWYLSIFWTSD